MSHEPEAALDHLDEIAALAQHPRPTAARYRLRDPGQVRRFLEALAEACEREQ